MASLNEFISSIKSHGVMPLNRYDVILGIPSSIIGFKGDLQTILMHCERVTLPNMNISCQRNIIYGEAREMPYDRLFGPVNMTFLVDGYMESKKFFDQWIHSIQDPGTRQFNFYKNYITDMEIKVYDKSDTEQYSVKLYECYPKDIGQIQLDNSSKDVMTFDVTMNYRYWTYTYPDESMFNDSKAPADNPFDDNVNNPNYSDTARIFPQI